MSREALKRLLEAFQAAQKLNEAAITLLSEGAPLERLDPIFASKAEIMVQIEAVDLERLVAENTDPLLVDTLQVQAACARSETRLAEALAVRRKQQKNVNDVTEAYRSKVVDNLGIKGLDLES